MIVNTVRAVDTSKSWFSTAELALMIPHLTRRMANHYVAVGHVACLGFPEIVTPGSGHNIVWPREVVVPIAILAPLQRTIALKGGACGDVLANAIARKEVGHSLDGDRVYWFVLEPFTFSVDHKSLELPDGF